MAGDKTPYAISVVIDLGVYGADGFTIEMDQTKRDTIPYIEPSLNHTTIGRLADNINDYEFVVHPGDFGYADDWYLKPHNLLDEVDAYEAILEQFYDQLAPSLVAKPTWPVPAITKLIAKSLTTPLSSAPQARRTSRTSRTDLASRCQQLSRLHQQTALPW